MFVDSDIGRWICDDGGNSSEGLLKRFLLERDLSEKKYKYVGVYSTKGWVVVDEWAFKNDGYENLVRITRDEGLVCFLKRKIDNGDHEPVFCVNYVD